MADPREQAVGPAHEGIHDHRHHHRSRKLHVRSPGYQALLMRKNARAAQALFRDLAFVIGGD